MSGIRFAKNDEGQSVAYEVTGSGPLAVVFIPDWVTNLDVQREEPSIARFLDRLASFSRLICFDKRGSGISDPIPLGAIPTPEEWMDDVRTVLDDLGIEKAALFGHGEGVVMAALFAATHPSRTTSLILADGCARRRRADDYPWGMPDHVVPKYMQGMIDTWGTGEGVRIGSGALRDSPGFFERRARLERLAMRPGEFEEIYPTTYEMDIRPVLPTIRVPTLVLHRRDNPYMHFGNGQFLAEQIEGAEFVPIDGGEHVYHAGDTDAMLGAVQEFLTGTRETPDEDRVLATVLFTDIVGATELAERMGDREWRDLLDRHHALVRQAFQRFRGDEVDNAGDGFFATFDGPARAVRCALAIRDLVRGLGLEIRAGVHVGEVEILRSNGEEKVGGIAVHIGARIMASAGAGEVLVSRTVKDLVVGSGISFEERGRHSLKGVAEEWEVFSAS